MKDSPLYEQKKDRNIYKFGDNVNKDESESSSDDDGAPLFGEKVDKDGNTLTDANGNPTSLKPDCPNYCPDPIALRMSEQEVKKYQDELSKLKAGSLDHMVKENEFNQLNENHKLIKEMDALCKNYCVKNDFKQFIDQLRAQFDDADVHPFWGKKKPGQGFEVLAHQLNQNSM